MVLALGDPSHVASSQLAPVRTGRDAADHEQERYEDDRRARSTRSSADSRRAQTTQGST